MSTPNSTVNKQDLLDLIINGGLLEDFIEWARKKGVPIDFAVKPNDIDLKIVEEYAREKGLIDEQKPLPGEELDDDIETLEPLEVRPRTPPRRE